MIKLTGHKHRVCQNMVTMSITQMADLLSSTMWDEVRDAKVRDNGPDCRHYSEKLHDQLDEHSLLTN